MLMNLQDISKTIGAKMLYEGLSLTLQDGEKVGLIGRNGIGKTTLLGIMAGTDKEYGGTIERRRGLVIASTTQEHHGLGDQKVLEYILENLPDYARLKHIIDGHPNIMGSDMKLITEYTDALGRFGELGYYDIEERAQTELAAFGLTPEHWNGPIQNLSGGQKRFVELVKVTLSEADLALIDEPTNHMDYVAKAAFIEWMKGYQQAVVVITHDRDVLAFVDRIVEIKDHGSVSFKGNYQAYLKQNSQSTQSGVEQYEIAQRTLLNLEKQLQSVRAKNAGSSKNPNPFIPMERRLLKQYNDLAAKTKKPTFWIDQESMNEMKGNAVEKYDKYKAKNIRLGVKGDHAARQLLTVQNLSLGYTSTLFEDVNFTLSVGERLRLHGRNGAGKSTLVKAIRAAAGDGTLDARVFAGQIELDNKLIIGQYEQEIDERFLSMKLGDAVMTIHREHNVSVNDQRVRQLLSDYLFDPTLDNKLEIRHLSGGQKARFQLIAMLCHSPNLLILDEPTNHLDLPSIEELEKAIEGYNGAVLYISHDSFFTKNIGGEEVSLAAPVSAA
jgi:ATPase subunit of ABC transporter with duplicated ATPase domains